MSEVAEIQRKIGRDIFDYPTLLTALPRYNKPRDKITRLLAGGDIIRIKKGLYSFNRALRGKAVERGYLANLIYGPSYVSLDYALSFYGMIPERVETVTSVTPRRSRLFRTPFGTFSYRMLSGSRYTLGAVLSADTETPFLIASPEKALADKVWADKRFSGRAVGDFKAYLVDDLRIPEDRLIRLDPGGMREIALAYESPKINNLLRYLESMEGSSRA